MEIDFETDDVPTVAPKRTISARNSTPRDSARVETADLEIGEGSEFSFPVSRTASASNPYFQTTATRQRIEECYDLMKTSAFFQGKGFEEEGIAKEVARYVRGGSGWTFLHQAAFWNHDEAVIWLLKHGADKTIRGRFDGKTPYDVALQNGRPKATTRVLELLEVKLPYLREGGPSRR